MALRRRFRQLKISNSEFQHADRRVFDLLYDASRDRIVALVGGPKHFLSKNDYISWGHDDGSVVVRSFNSSPGRDKIIRVFDALHVGGTTALCIDKDTVITGGRGSLARLAANERSQTVTNRKYGGQVDRAANCHEYRAGCCHFVICIRQGIYVGFGKIPENLYDHFIQ